MAISVNFNTSPRIITVLAPATSISLQELVDDVREIEHKMFNLIYPKLLNASGKEDLGGGVFVGITVELQNAVVAFEPRTTSDSAGSATTADPTGTTLIDSTATFITDGIVAGDTIYNTTDASVTSVISVDSQTQITHFPLADGTDNDWDSSDAYTIWNKVQCEINGGNLVAVDGAGTAISAILPTAFTHVVRTASSSATLQELSAVQYSSFNGGVSVDTTSSFSGTIYPVGTPEFPVNNLSDAVLIADTRGFIDFFIIGDITVSSGDFSDNHNFVGQSPTLTTITIDAAANVTNCEFRNATITGTLDGNNTLRFCSLETINFVQGQVFSCVLGDFTITLGGAFPAIFLDCWSGVPGANTPTIDMGGSGQGLALRGYSGGIEISNHMGTDEVSVDMHSGQVILASTITNGTIYVRGVARLEDNTTGSAVVNTEGLLNTQTIADQVWDEVVTEHTTAGTFGTAVGSEPLTLPQFLALKK